MQEEEFKMAMQHAVIAYQALEGHDWDGAVATCNYGESVGPILYPSEFIAGSDNLRQNKKVLEAARDFVNAMRPVMSEAMKEVHGL